MKTLSQLAPLTWRKCVVFLLTILLVMCYYFTDTLVISPRHKLSLDHHSHLLFSANTDDGIEGNTATHGCYDNRKPLCPAMPPNLRGREKLVLNITEKEAAKFLGDEIKDGGSNPSECESRWRLAVIVPYRDREHQVGPFVYRLHTILRRQQLNYSIYIIEQAGDKLFNRAKLLNVGYKEANSRGPYDCFAFHDIDMLPEDDRHLYHCSAQPRHLVVACSNNKYKSALTPSLRHYFGGACLMTKEHMVRVNGWSNRFWGWGGEDDDMMNRLTYEKLPVWRYPAAVARYTMVSHKPPGRNMDSFGDVARNRGKHRTDGLSRLTYKVISYTSHHLYSHVLVDIDEV